VRAVDFTRVTLLKFVPDALSVLRPEVATRVQQVSPPRPQAVASSLARSGGDLVTCSPCARRHSPAVAACGAEGARRGRPSAPWARALGVGLGRGPWARALGAAVSHSAQLPHAGGDGRSLRARTALHVCVLGELR
jgi:hypothetical protein